MANILVLWLVYHTYSISLFLNLVKPLFNNDIIRKLAKNPRWTVPIDKKCPADIRAIIETGRIFGAKNEQCLVTLPDLLTEMKKVSAMPKHLTYLLDAERDKIVVLDVEPSCPVEIKNYFLAFNFDYGETSMSGNGLHLLFSCPKLDEITRTKRVMRRLDGYYEILLNHYVTFTMNVIKPAQTLSQKTFQDVWDELAAQQKLTVVNEINFENAIPNFDEKIYKNVEKHVVTAFYNQFVKTPKDYNNDMSRYEFAVVGYIRTQLWFYAPKDIDENSRIWMVYEIAQKLLQHRAKHDEKRSNQPYLFNMVCRNFATANDYLG